MPHYALSSLIDAFVCLSIATALLLRARRQAWDLILVLYALAVWMSIPWAAYVSPTPYQSQVINHILDIAVCVPALVLLFALRTMGKPLSHPALKISALFSAFFVLTHRSSLFVLGSRITSSGVTPIPGPLYFGFLIYFAVLVLYAIFAVYSAYRKATGWQKTRLRWMLLAWISGFLGKAAHAVLSYSGREPFSHHLFIIAFASVLGYALLTGRLYDIDWWGAGRDMPELPPNYKEAFLRNRGLIGEGEQRVLRNACVAVAGAGGVGGIHLLTLARMGVGKFHLADFDKFERANLNRQFGATISTLGRSKIEVMGEMLRDVNPDVQLRFFPEGVQPDNITSFLEGADIVLDGIDFFAYDARRMLFNEARKRGLYVLTAGPIGFGATLQIFSPTGMGFDEWFGISDTTPEFEKFIAFLVGIAPAFLHRHYLDMSQVDLAKGRGPVVAAGCVLGSGLIAIEAIKVLLKRGPIVSVPHYFQFDAYRQIYKKGYLPGGARNPLQWFKRWMLRKQMKQLFSGGIAERASEGSGAGGVGISDSKQ